MATRDADLDEKITNLARNGAVMLSLAENRGLSRDEIRAGVLKSVGGAIQREAEDELEKERLIAVVQRTVDEALDEIEEDRRSDGD